jgi:hypothetical protein
MDDLDRLMQQERANFYRGIKDVLLELSSEEWAYLRAWRDADADINKQDTAVVDAEVERRLE